MEISMRGPCAPSTHVHDRFGTQMSGYGSRREPIVPAEHYITSSVLSGAYDCTHHSPGVYEQDLLLADNGLSSEETGATQHMHRLDERLD